MEVFDNKREKNTRETLSITVSWSYPNTWKMMVRECQVVLGKMSAWNGVEEVHNGEIGDKSLLSRFSLSTWGIS
jgi:hypothetical protein